MTKPLPLAVYGPVTPISPSVRVTGVLANVDVDILMDGAKIGSVHVDVPGETWVPLSQKPAVGKLITAVQRSGAEVSDPSPQPVPVVDVPDPLPTPVIASALNTCVVEVGMDALVPGATVFGEIAGQQFAKTLVDKPATWLGIDKTKPIPAGSTLTVYQEAQVGGAARQSATAHSLPIPQFTPEGRVLAPPQLATPLVACQTNLQFAKVAPGALTTIENEGQTETWPNISGGFNGYGGFPLRQGKLIATQEMARCHLKSEKAVYDVVPDGQAPQPIVTQAICPKVLRLTVSNLLPGGKLTISRVVRTSAVGTSSTLLGEIGIGFETQQIDLPPNLDLSDPQGPVSLWLTQSRCGPASTHAEVGVAQPGGPYGAAQIVPPIIDCARAISVTGAHVGALIQAFDEDTNLPISDPIAASGPDLLLRLWFPAIAGRRISVRQTGCNADGKSAILKVDGLPNPFPVPTIQKYLRPGDTIVNLGNVLPGARVSVLVDNVLRTTVDVWNSTPGIVLPPPALAEGQHVFAIQSLCDKNGPLDGEGVKVTRGHMKVSASPGSIPRGKPTAVTVTAKDADTGAPIAGQVVLNGTNVAATGQAFTVTTTSGAASLSGTVKEPVGHFDEPFSIGLYDPTWLITLVAAPVPVYLGSNVKINLDAVNWVLTPRWNPALQKKVPGSAGSGNILATTSFPQPTGAEKNVDVTMEMKCSTGGGTYNGYVIPAQSDVTKTGDPIVIAFDGKNKRAGWLLQAGYVSDQEAIVFTVTAHLQAIVDG